MNTTTTTKENTMTTREEWKIAQAERYALREKQMDEAKARFDAQQAAFRAADLAEVDRFAHTAEDQRAQWKREQAMRVRIREELAAKEALVQEARAAEMAAVKARLAAKASEAR